MDRFYLLAPIFNLLLTRIGTQPGRSRRRLPRTATSGFPVRPLITLRPGRPGSVRAVGVLKFHDKL